MASGQVAYQPDGNVPALAALNWLASDVRPRLIVSDGLRLLWCNAAAQNLLSAGRSLTNHRGLLVGTDAARQADLEQLVLAASRSPTIAMLRSHNGGSCIIHAEKLSRPEDQFSLGLQVRQIDHDASFGSLDHLMKIFRLTAAEFEVLTDLISGLAPEEIHRKRGTSIQTVRTQIRDIYAKFGVNNRGKLFSRVSSLCF